jgi:hypothetical protein
MRLRTGNSGSSTTPEHPRFNPRGDDLARFWPEILGKRILDIGVVRLLIA